MKTVVTAADRRALLNADQITFHLADGQARITAHRNRERTSSGFAESVNILAGGQLVTDYHPPRDSAMRYSAYVHTYANNDVVRTLIGRMSTGSTCELVWTRSNQSPLFDEAGFWHDELRLRVTHATGKHETYLVDEYVGPDNSARMVRVA